MCVGSRRMRACVRACVPRYHRSDEKLANCDGGSIAPSPIAMPFRLMNGAPCLFPVATGCAALRPAATGCADAPPADIGERSDPRTSSGSVAIHR